MRIFVTQNRMSSALFGYHILWPASTASDTVFIFLWILYKKQLENSGNLWKGKYWKILEIISNIW